MRPLRRLALFLLALAATARAHPDLQNTLWLLFEPAGARVAVNVTLKEILVTSGIAEREDGAYDLAALDRAASAHGDYVRAHLHFEAAGRALAGRVVKITPPLLLGSVENSLYQYELSYPAAPGAAEIRLRHDMLREHPYAPGQAWNLSYVVRVKYAGSDEVASWQLRADEPLTLLTAWPATPTPTPAAERAVPATRGAWLAAATAGAAAATALILRAVRRAPPRA